MIDKSLYKGQVRASWKAHDTAGRVDNVLSGAFKPRLSSSIVSSLSIIEDIIFTASHKELMRHDQVAGANDVNFLKIDSKQAKDKIH